MPIEKFEPWRSPALLNLLPHAGELGVPACGADHHILAGSHAGFDVGEHAVRSSEVDDDVDVVKLVRGERGAGGVLCGTRDSDLVPPSASHFRHQRSNPAA